MTIPDKASRSEREEEEETTDRQSLTVMTRWATRLKMENRAEAGSWTPRILKVIFRCYI